MSFAFPIQQSVRPSRSTARDGSTCDGSHWPDWQLELTHTHPDALLRGLVHTDGCRAVNRFRTKPPSGRIANYEYVRYFFSNLSADIRDIFIVHAALLGIRVTQSNPRNLSIAHRDSVAILERTVGIKN